MPVADQVNANYFYIYEPFTGKMYRSTNKGVNFSVAGTPGNSTANYPWESATIRTVPGYTGHVWVPRGRNGLKYSTDYGVNYTNIAGVTYCKSMAIGKAKVGATYPTIFIWGTVSGVTGLFQSTNQGTSWTRMNDDTHEFGGASLLIGDMDVFGRVYMASNGGRGVLYWEPDGTSTGTESPTFYDNKMDEVVVFPNPTKDGNFTIVLPVIVPKASVKVFDNQGRLLFETMFANSKKLDVVSGLKAGIYIVKVTSDEMNYTHKLIVQ
jgi:hypothetical protein